jgi:hypothetical protein
MLLSDPIEIFNKKLPTAIPYKNPTLDLPDAEDTGFISGTNELLKFSPTYEPNEIDHELQPKESRPIEKPKVDETTLEDFDVGPIEDTPEVFRTKKKPGFNWDFDSERFQDEPWKMSKYDHLLNTIFINDNHQFWHNIRNLPDESLKFHLKWDYIVALTIKEIILYNLQRQSNPFANQFDNNMEMYIRFSVKFRELQFK